MWITWENFLFSVGKDVDVFGERVKLFPSAFVLVCISCVESMVFPEVILGFYRPTFLILHILEFVLFAFPLFPSP